MIKINFIVANLVNLNNQTNQSKMKQLSPYLNFENNCREAMTFYKSVFGGDLDLMTIGSSPMAGEMPPETHNNIMHANLKFGNDMSIMASDLMGNDKFVQGNAFNIAVGCSSPDEIKMHFEKLSAGGNVFCKLEKTFFAELFAGITDKFGVTWLLVYGPA